jgi:hypothetical protein
MKKLIALAATLVAFLLSGCTQEQTSTNCIEVAERVVASIYDGVGIVGSDHDALVSAAILAHWSDWQPGEAGEESDRLRFELRINAYRSCRKLEAGEWL